jgi:predicted aspartyl protease
MLCVTFWMLLTAPAAVADMPPPPQTTHFEAVSSSAPAAPADPAIALAMRDDGHARMTVPVGVGTRDFRFRVDTGSARTSVSRELVRALGLREQPQATLHSATGHSEVRMAWLPELRLDRRIVRNIRAPMLDARDMGADGILGVDSLRSHRVVFDFAQGTLSILPAGEHFDADKDAIVVRGKRREGRLMITDAEIDGERVTVVIDSGSSLTIGNQALRRRLERHGRLGQTSPIDIISVTGGALRGDLARAGQLVIGGARLDGLGVVFADAHTFRLLGLDRKPAILLGMNALGGFDQVAIDFAEKRLVLVLPKARKRGAGA